MAINAFVSKIILRVKGINAPIKRHRVVDWLNKTRTCNISPRRDPLQGEGHRKVSSVPFNICKPMDCSNPGLPVHHQFLEVKRQKKILQTNEYDKKVGVAILTLDKMDFKTKAIKKR